MSSLLNTCAVKCTFTAIDFETTGTVKGYTSLPWQLGTATLSAGIIDPGAPHFDTLLFVPPEHPFSKHAPGNPAQLRAALQEAPAFHEVWPALHQQLAATIPLAHNAATERTVLARQAPLTRYPYWVDTLPLARKIYPGLPSYALDDLIPQLGLQDELTAVFPDRAPHDARYDAYACALLLRHLLSLPGWKTLTLAELLAQ